MKSAKILLLVAAIGIVLSACKEDTVKVSEATIEGTWDLNEAMTFAPI